ncbi:hypothetical protein GGTG_00690 [Gaeumannomyces tritici R3-111a-1]|uniref:Uncharacterized protein n=1 Tax=Gaeumannomyces tritici (strain R3-111a-1) TaxID=644352 RepID=J3NHF3_GAET3|nr:hypothetical protein GGTG_00690 [Gaeumannomyces tritici R3-111a-1]EJT80696.1 hypothetical protein GGTG_00690 [Gaeumannomyces tritici R3-111a-1]
MDSNPSLQLLLCFKKAMSVSISCPQMLRHLPPPAQSCHLIGLWVCSPKHVEAGWPDSSASATAPAPFPCRLRVSPLHEVMGSPPAEPWAEVAIEEQGPRLTGLGSPPVCGTQSSKLARLGLARAFCGLRSQWVTDQGFNHHLCRS